MLPPSWILADVLAVLLGKQPTVALIPDLSELLYLSRPNHAVRYLIYGVRVLGNVFPFYQSKYCNLLKLLMDFAAFWFLNYFAGITFHYLLAAMSKIWGQDMPCLVYWDPRDLVKAH